MGRCHCIVLVFLSVVYSQQVHALSAKVLDVASTEHVVVSVYNVPVAVGLAHVDVPVAQMDAAIALIKSVTAGKKVSVFYKPEYGVTAEGLGRVHLRTGSKVLNQVLVEKGLAKYVKAGEGAHDRLFARLESQAKGNSLGLWAKSTSEKRLTVAEKMPRQDTRLQGKVKPARKGKDLPFCAELGNKYFYPSGDPAVARVKASRLIYYKSEAAAKRAGKKPAPQRRTAPQTIDIASADAAFEKGKSLYSEAVNLPATSKRNQLYDQAFKHFTDAMQIYNRLVAKNPGDAGLGEKLRRTSQLRYGAMKQRTL